MNAFYEASLFGGKNGSWQWLYIQSCWGNFHHYMEVGIGTNLENFQGFSSWLQGWWKFVENQSVPSLSSTRQGVWGGVLRVIEGPHTVSGVFRFGKRQTCYFSLRKMVGTKSRKTPMQWNYMIVLYYPFRFNSCCWYGESINHWLVVKAKVELLIPSGLIWENSISKFLSRASSSSTPGGWSGKENSSHPREYGT